jgi:hypothetical protein
MIENVSNLTCLREVLAPELARLEAQTLHSMKYYIKAQYGFSSTYNGHLKPDPFLGSGQGAGDSMARWAFLSDAIVRAYNKQIQSADIQSPTSKIRVQENIQAIVDDSHSFMIRDPSDTTPLPNIIRHNM